jgi:hypothetical protein
MKWQAALFFGLILGLSGCGPTTHTVSGTVKLDGEPIAEGRITFVPEESGPGGGGPITGGHYSVAVPAGKAKVQVAASKMMKLPKGEKGMYGKTEEMRDYIPSKYNANTELKAEITRSIKLDFDLKSEAESQ